MSDIVWRQRMDHRIVELLLCKRSRVGNLDTVGKRILIVRSPPLTPRIAALAS